MQPALSSPPSPLPCNKGTINNQSSLSSCQFKLLSAYAMLLPPTHRCCRRHHHAAAAFPNTLLLLLKLRFCPTSTATLAATTVLPLPPPLPPRGHYRATTAYKIKNAILWTNLFFHHDGNSSNNQQQWQSHKTMTIAMLLFATT